MPRSLRKRKLPITTTAPSSQNKPSSKSTPNPTHTRSVIRKFHVLLKQEAILVAKNDDASKTELDRIRCEMEELGGLEEYQRMSEVGQQSDRGGGSERVLVKWIRQLRRDSVLAHPNRKLKLLEVGALKPDNYKSFSSWIDCTPIDLHSRHPAILEQDFLLMDPASHAGSWDVISLSLVLNFVPSPNDRGKMLALAHSMLQSEGGLLFIVLPLPCILNSRYLDFATLKSMMSHIGFRCLKEQWKDTGKVAYWLFVKDGDSSYTMGASSPWKKKRVLREGNRNNFSILLD